MGSSAKKKKEKKKDFQKPKLRVGKSKPKAANQTDTSFKSQAIVLNQQSLNVIAPSVAHQFHQHVSMLTSRSDSQRKESLAYLTTYVSGKPVDASLPQPAGTLIDKICPLILDGSMGVRNQLLKFFEVLQADDLQDHVSKILPFVRAGMTHLSRDVRISTTELLSWLLSTAGAEVVSCPGGWVKTLDSFVTLLGWKVRKDSGKWSSSSTSFGTDTKMIARVMQILARLLQIGFDAEDESSATIETARTKNFPLWCTAELVISIKSNAYSYLDLFGTRQVEENQILEDREDRISAFNDRFRKPIMTGIEAAKQEGGELGRAAGMLRKSLTFADP